MVGCCRTVAVAGAARCECVRHFHDNSTVSRSQYRRPQPHIKASRACQYSNRSRTSAGPSSPFVVIAVRARTCETGFSTSDSHSSSSTPRRCLHFSLLSEFQASRSKTLRKKRKKERKKLADRPVHARDFDTLTSVSSRCRKCRPSSYSPSRSSLSLLRHRGSQMGRLRSTNLLLSGRSTKGFLGLLLSAKGRACGEWGNMCMLSSWLSSRVFVFPFCFVWWRSYCCTISIKGASTAVLPHAVVLLTPIVNFRFSSLSIGH